MAAIDTRAEKKDLPPRLPKIDDTEKAKIEIAKRIAQRFMQPGDTFEHWSLEHMVRITRFLGDPGFEWLLIDRCAYGQWSKDGHFLEFTKPVCMKGLPDGI